MNATQIKTVLRERYGQFDSFLEHEYEETITKKLMTGKISTKEEWATYNQVLLELKNNIQNTLLVKELQYRLTDNENPNTVCLEVINKIPNQTPELDRLHDKIISFILTSK